MKTEEGLEFSPVQVDLSHCYNMEDAIRKFRMMVQKEGILQKLKEKEGYEKPSVKKRRKKHEAIQRRMFEEMKEKQMLSGEWDKRMKEKEEKRLAKRKNHQAEQESSWQ